MRTRCARRLPGAKQVGNADGKWRLGQYKGKQPVNRTNPESAGGGCKTAARPKEESLCLMSLGTELKLSNTVVTATIKRKPKKVSNKNAQPSHG